MLALRIAGILVVLIVVGSVVGYFLTRRLGDPAVADPGARPLLELVETHVLRAHRGHELHRDGHETEGNVAAPDGAGHRAHLLAARRPL